MSRTKGSKNKIKEEELLEILEKQEIPFEEDSSQDNNTNITDDSDNEDDAKGTIVQINASMRVLVTRRVKTLQIYRKNKNPITKEETEGWTFGGYHVWWTELLKNAIRTSIDEKILAKNEIVQIKDLVKIIKDTEKEVKGWSDIHV